MNIRILDKMPTEGRFVQIWVYNNLLWAGTFKTAGGELCDTYVTDGDYWVGFTLDEENACTLAYLVLDE